MKSKMTAITIGAVAGLMLGLGAIHATTPTEDQYPTEPEPTVLCPETGGCEETTVEETTVIASPPPEETTIASPPPEETTMPTTPEPTSSVPPEPSTPGNPGTEPTGSVPPEEPPNSPPPGNPGPDNPGSPPNPGPNGPGVPIIVNPPEVVEIVGGPDLVVVNVVAAELPPALFVEPEGAGGGSAGEGFSVALSDFDASGEIDRAEMERAVLSVSSLGELPETGGPSVAGLAFAAFAVALGVGILASQALR